MNYITIDQAQDVLAKSPDPYTIVPSREFSFVLLTGKHKGCTFILTTNYRCLDNALVNGEWSWDQRIRYEGMRCSIWFNYLSVRHFFLSNRDNVAAIIADLLRDEPTPVVEQAKVKPPSKKSVTRAKKAEKKARKVKNSLKG